LGKSGLIYCEKRNNPLDRLDALTIFVAVAEQGSFVGAARRLGRSPAAVTRAVAALEDRLGTRLLNRTTRAVALTDAGARYLDSGRRLLAELEDLDAGAAGERATPRGALAVTAPILFGRLHVLPVALGFLQDHPAVDLRLLLVDRVVSLVDEGIDVGVRLGRLPDSTLRAIPAGSVRRAVYASPDYLARHGTPAAPQDLAGHVSIAFADGVAAAERWSFGRDAAAFAVAVRPRLAVNTAEAAVDAAVAGLGVTRVMTYQAAAMEQAGRLIRILREHESPAVPIQVIHPAGRHLPAKVRLFVDRAVAALRARFGSGGTMSAGSTDRHD
jgi:DNA-binding transcriptional LysR family regulator